MAEARQETAVWTTVQVLAWMRQHLDDGHDVRLRGSAPDDEDTHGLFQCRTCGQTLDARPVVASDPMSGLYAVTGAVPLTAPRVVALPTEERAVLSIVRAHQRVRLSVGRHGACVELAPDQARTLAAALLEKATQLELSVSS
jgi:hypothetical protein